MSFLETYRAKKTEKKEEVAKAADPHYEEKLAAESGPAFSEIYSNPERNRMFGILLAKEGREDLAKKLVQGKLDGLGFEDVEKYRQKFNTIANRAEKIKGQLNAEKIIELAKYSPGLKRIMGKDVDKLVAVLEKEIEELAYRDEAEFNKILASLENLKTLEEELPKLEKKTQDVIKKYYLRPAEFQAALELPPAERSAALQKMARDSLSWYDNVMDKYGDRSRGAKAEMESTYRAIEHAMSDLDARMENVGNVIQGIFSNDPVVSEAFTRAITNEKPVPKKFISVQEAKRLPDLSDEQIDSDWAEYKGKIPGYGKLADVDKQTHQQKFRDQESKKVDDENVGRGLWAVAFGEFMGGSKNRIKNKKLF